MFLGHFALGFAAKKGAPRVSLGWFFIAVQLLDLLWPLFLLLGIESVAIGGPSPPGLLFTFYPYSHSLLFVLFWAVLFGVLAYARTKTLGSSILLGLLVLSHWFLDLLVHVPDLPLYPGGPTVGFGLWSTPYLETILEVALFAVGLAWYLLATKAKQWRGHAGLWALVVLLLGVHLASGAGPAPPSVLAVALAGLLQWLFVALAFWTEQYRVART